MKPRFIAVALVALVSVSSAQVAQDFRNTTMTNLTGTGIDAMEIKGRDGSVVAHLIVTGKSMTFGSDQRPVRGAGFIIGTMPFSVLILPPGRPAPGGTQAKQLNQIAVKQQGGYLTFGGGLPLGTGEIPDLSIGQMPQGSLLLKMDYITWSEDGTTQEVGELQPLITCSNGKQVRITSLLKKPAVSGGLLSIDTTAGKLPLRIRFGGYASAESPTELLCTATANKKLPQK